MPDFSRIALESQGSISVIIRRQAVGSTNPMPVADEPAVSIAVVIPAYQAETSIVQVVTEFAAVVDRVIVVDDGSSDQTGQAAEALALEGLQVIRHGANRGVGASTKTGIRTAIESRVDIVVKVDADGQMSAEDLPRLLEPLLSNRADVSKGNRWHDRTSLAAMPTIRRWGNLWLSLLTRVASGQWRIFDPNNGYIAWRTELLERVDPDRVPDGFTFEAGMLKEVGILGGVIEDVPLPARYGDHGSHLRVGRSFLEFSAFLLKGIPNRIWRQYFLTDFNTVSLLLLAGSAQIAFGALFGGYHWWRSSQTGIPATAGTVIIAALPILLGFNCLLQALMIDVTTRPLRKACSDLVTGANAAPWPSRGTRSGSEKS